MEKTKKRRLIMTVFIIFIMSFSVLSYSLFYVSNTGEKNVKYKDKKFTFINNLWVTQINEKQLGIINDPNSLNNLDLSGFNLKGFDKVYLSKAPNYNLNNELSGLSNIRSFLGTIFVDSCFEDAEGCKNLPLKKCEDATNSIGVIEISINNENVVKREGNCLKINGDTNFISRIIDKIVLDTLL